LCARFDVSRERAAEDELGFVNAWCSVDSACCAALTAGLRVVGVGASPTLRATERTAEGIGTPTA
jgi:hypothetical protein